MRCANEVAAPPVLCVCKIAGCDKTFSASPSVITLARAAIPNGATLINA